jgi:hypothetical protein
LINIAYVGVQVCDFCGRRSEKVIGRLRLSKHRDHYGGTGTLVRTWMLCPYCFRKLSGMRTFGDNIKEAIEVELDKLRGDKSNIKLLENINLGKED